MMCIDILEREEIITYRENEHDLLMDIRNGVYLDSNRQPTKEFFELVEEYKCRFEYAKNNSSLPLKPDINKIEEFKAFVNEEVVKGGYNGNNPVFYCDSSFRLLFFKD